MRTPHLPRTVVASLTLSGLLTGSGMAADPPAPAAKTSVQQLLQRDLPQMAGKEVILLTVTTPPGGASPAHRHDAEVFVYMLEGSMLMQVDGQPAVTLGPGQTFHESPTDVHRRSANASATQPAKFLVFMIKDKGKPVTLPVTQR